jgi:hypothetical protein
MLRNDILQEDPKNNYMNICSLNDIHSTTASICLPSTEKFSSTVKQKLPKDYEPNQKASDISMFTYNPLEALQ